MGLAFVMITSMAQPGKTAFENGKQPISSKPEQLNQYHIFLVLGSMEKTAAKILAWDNLLIMKKEE